MKTIKLRRRKNLGKWKTEVYLLKKDVKKLIDEFIKQVRELGCVCKATYMLNRGKCKYCKELDKLEEQLKSQVSGDKK